MFGSGTNEFVKCIFGDVINVPLDSCASSFFVSMKRLSNGDVVTKNSESFTYLQESDQSAINVQLVFIKDDNFFHHCCSWMFTSKSIYILAFDFKQLVNSNNSMDFEMKRLFNLAHTVRTSTPGAFNNLKLFALTAESERTSPEEVQTLFYTQLAASLLPSPQVIPISPGGCNTSGVEQTRNDIFASLSSICQQQQVCQQVATAMDFLLVHRSLTVSVEEIADSLHSRPDKSSQIKVQVTQVLEDLIRTGNLIDCGELNRWLQ